MKEQLKRYRKIKAIELIIFLVMEVVFLFILISNKAMRSSIFMDKSLFILCAIAYISIIFTFATLIYDFIKLRNLSYKD